MADMKKSISLTPEARKHLQENLQHSPAGTLGIRIALRDAGCSGFAYTFDFVAQLNADDQSFEVDGIKIFIPQKNLNALQGSEIDFIRDGISSILKVNNPNVVHECGCGESFQIKDDIN